MTSAVPGWYHAVGDPDGTLRWWDGTTWVGGPTSAPTTVDEAAPEAASVGRRVAATAIDLAIWLLVIIVVWLAAFLGWVLEGFSLLTYDPATDFRSPDLFLVHLTMFGLLALTVLAGKTTPGKALTGLKIVTEDGERPDTAHLVRRMTPLTVWFIPEIGGLVLLVLFIASIVMVPSDIQRSVFDRVSDTKVVRR